MRKTKCKAIARKLMIQAAREMSTATNKADILTLNGIMVNSALMVLDLRNKGVK